MADFLMQPSKWQLKKLSPLRRQLRELKLLVKLSVGETDCRNAQHLLSVI